MKNKILLLLVIVAIGCHKKDPISVVPDPATLVFPALNAVCTAGTVISTTQSTVIFNWNASANTNSYDLTIKNLLTGVTTTQNVGTNQLAVTLLRNTPYSWYVVSKSISTSTTAKSDTWKFYNSGPGTVNYPPFPAAITAPVFSQNITAANNVVNLLWTGSDTDGDIVGYDVYFGTTSSPPLLKSNVADMFLNNVSVPTKTTYYWKIVTKDLMGNTSDSGLYQFTVN